MSNEIIKVLDELGKRFGIAIDWSNQNIMPYLQELGTRFITYKTATGILAIIVLSILIVISSIAIAKLVKWRKSDKFDDSYCGDDNFIFIFSIAMLVCTIAGLAIGIICNITGIMQNLIMPELTIINYLKGVIK